MDFLSQLNTDSSRANIDLMVDAIGKNEKYFLEVYKYMLLNHYPVSARAARVIDHCCEKHPELFYLIFDDMLQQVPTFEIDGVKRQFVRMLTRYDISDKYQGKVLDLCLGYIEDARQAIAVRAFSMYVVYNISEKEPELKPELIYLLTEMHIEHANGLEGLRIKLLKKLRKETNLTNT